MYLRSNTNIFTWLGLVKEYSLSPFATIEMVGTFDKSRQIVNKNKNNKGPLNRGGTRYEI